MLAFIGFLGARQSQICYSAAVLGIILAFIGRRKTMKRAISEYANRSDGAEVKPTLGMYMQVVLAIVGVIVLGAWLA